MYVQGKEGLAQSRRTANPHRHIHMHSHVMPAAGGGRWEVGPPEAGPTQVSLVKVLRSLGLFRYSNEAFPPVF